MKQFTDIVKYNLFLLLSFSLLLLLLLLLALMLLQSMIYLNKSFETKKILQQ